jgi:hypothetical protein
MPAYAVTIFLGAFLLFQLQPLIGKFILPWFGGGPGVWTVCLLFFQTLLLGGYAYAHWTNRLAARRQALVHLALVLGAVLLLPIIPPAGWKPAGTENPTLHILGLLMGTVGGPYFVLASTSPLLQQWFGRTHPGRAPYRLYALSNAGSLLGLLSYPFVVEPRLTRPAQARFWGCGLVLYALGCAWCALKVWKSAAGYLPGAVPDAAHSGHKKNPPTAVLSQREVARPSREAGHRPAMFDRILWLLLPACGSVLLLAFTNKICQDVAVVPFLWVMPLSLYLLSFIISFDSSRWYARFPFALALTGAAAGICWALFHASELAVWEQLVFYAGGLFVCCMVCHGELYRLRPDPTHLTGFYLLIAAGGALGGFFVAVFAPVVFRDYYELHWGLGACAALLAILCLRDARRAKLTAPGAKTQTAATQVQNKSRAVLRSIFSQPGEWTWLGCTLPLIGFWGLDRFLAGFGQELGQAPNRTFVVMRIALWSLLGLLILTWVARGKLRQFTHWPWLACSWLVLGAVSLGVALWMQALKSGGGVVSMSRNFYGVLTVYEHEAQTPKDHHFLLRHGRITHGLQFVEPAEALWPTAYYGAESGIGLAMQSLPDRPVRIGLVGLGVGTLAAYSRPGDEVRIYEINPEVERLAQTRFTYLNRCPGQVEVISGDARLSLERETPRKFDLLALDAFNSDSIPVHLLTREAFEIYDRHLNTNGLLAVHISNHYLNLEPVVAGLASTFHFQSARIDYDEVAEQWWLYPSTWMLLTRDPDLLTWPELAAAITPASTNKTSLPLWTDDYASLFRILKAR